MKILIFFFHRRRKRSKEKENPFDDPVREDLPEGGPYYSVVHNSPEVNGYQNGGADLQPSLNPYENLHTGPDLNPEIRPASPDPIASSTEISPMYSNVAETAAAEERNTSYDNPQPLDPSVIYAMPMKRKIQPH